ncbi:hypothetical protein [Streptomyces atacamensis]|uniref:hypothetical protein n=1 Tax=Streptomyces atacamensis TaxID=531966 RepID=UPI00399D1847
MPLLRRRCSGRRDPPGIDVAPARREEGGPGQHSGGRHDPRLPRDAHDGLLVAVVDVEDGPGLLLGALGVGCEAVAFTEDQTGDPSGTPG